MGFEQTERIDQRSHEDLSHRRQDRGLHAADPRHEQDVSSNEDYGEHPSHQDPWRRCHDRSDGDREAVLPDRSDDQKRSKSDHEIQHGSDEGRSHSLSQLRVDAGLHGHSDATGQTKQ